VLRIKCLDAPRKKPFEDQKTDAFQI
jgi:hypothetical protein